ncbi:MAG: LamG domain-containing protein [Candidatus Jorgensenbacteria bacterium]|nr:LamG domain-containing protein [Candidatus Jorgensenbacteria bacterium]
MNKTKIKKLAHEITSVLAVVALILTYFGAGIFTTKAAALTDSLVSYYKFDEASGNAADSAGANTGTVSATMTYGTTGKIGTAYTLSGNDYISVNGLSSLGTAYSISMWIKTAGGTYRSLLDSYSPRFMFHLNRAANTLGFLDNATVKESNLATPTDNAWHHVVLSYSGATAYIYLDGIQSTQLTGLGSIDIGADVTFGASYDETAWFYSGDMDEIGVWSRALTSTEVTTLYNSGNGLAYPLAIAPTVTTQAASSVGSTTATGNGNITATNGANATTRGFKYGLTETDTWSISEDGSFGTGAFTGSLTGLSPGTTYYSRAFAMKGTPWSLSTASYDSVNYAITNAKDNKFGVSFKPDGTSMYITSYDATYHIVGQYTLSTPWDVSTASYNSSYSVAGQSYFTAGVFFKGDGTKMYVTDYGAQKVFQYSLSSAWDVTSATYDTKFMSTASGSPINAYFKSDGTKMYVSPYDTKIVTQYSLSTPWDVSTASYDSKSFSVGSQLSRSDAVFFNSDGTKMFSAGYGVANSYQYTLSTPWDVSTASYDSVSFANSPSVTLTSSYFKPDGTSMYLLDIGQGKVYQYSITSFGYGSYVSFATITASPVVTTQAASSVSSTTATANGNITDIGGSSPTTRGFKYGLTETDTWTVSESGTYDTGAYTGSLTGLSPGTTYYVRSFATNAQGTAYGSYVSFATPAVAPTITTSGITNIGVSSSTLNGNITATGGANATARGFKYGLTQDDTWTVSESGSYGTGEYSLLVSELSAGVTYYVRAFATNSGGTSYGSYTSFTTGESQEISLGSNVIFGSDVIFR